MINGKQIRAARALLEWDAKDLSSKTGLSLDTIFKIETGAVQARGGSIVKIVQVFEDNGVEFTEQSGVRLRRQGVEVLTGREGLQQFFDGVYEYARQHGGTIVQFGVDESLFLHHLGKEFSADYVNRMQTLSDERKDLKVKAIICEGVTQDLAPDYNEYRWISKNIFQAVPFYICGETLAVMDFQTVPAPTIVLLKFRAITNAYRKQFDAFWEMASTTSKISHKAKEK